MQAFTPDARHFARTVTALGERRRVVADAPIYTDKGVKIIDKGVAIDARLYERLTEHRLKTPLAESLDTSPTVSGTSLRDEARALCAQDRLGAAIVDDLRGAVTLFEELERVPLPRAIAFQLTVMREMQPELWRHSLRSAVTAAWLAARSGAPRHDQRLLAAAGLLHDLGHLHLDPVLLQRQHALTREQRRHLYSHPLVSALLLERQPEYPKELQQAVLEHHEALDGSGYPRHLSGAELSPWGRMLALMEMVSALSSGEAPVLRLSIALRMSGERFDPGLAREVQRLLHPLREAPPPAEADPVPALLDIGRALGGWPAAVRAAPDLNPARKLAAHRVAELCSAARKALAASGAAPEQLPLLGDGGDDASAGELALIAREAAWQLRMVARQARRRWRLAAGEAFPESIQAWLDEVDALCARLPGGQA